MACSIMGHHEAFQHQRQPDQTDTERPGWKETGASWLGGAPWQDFYSFGMQINAEKTKLMTNNTNGFSTDIRVNGEKLDCVNKFKYLGAIIADEGSKPEILARIAQARAALAKLVHLEWQEYSAQLKDQTDALPSHVHIPVACESWTLTADT